MTADPKPRTKKNATTADPRRGSHSSTFPSVNLMPHLSRRDVTNRSRICRTVARHRRLLLARPLRAAALLRECALAHVADSSLVMSRRRPNVGAAGGDDAAAAGPIAIAERGKKSNRGRVDGSGEPIGVNFAPILEKTSVAHLSRDRRILTGAKGYRLVRANAGVSTGTWFCEFFITDLKPGAHVRVGFADSKAAHHAPVGFDHHSYAFRDEGGCRVHQSVRHRYGRPFGAGDVIGCLVSFDSAALTDDELREAEAHDEGASTGPADAERLSAALSLAASVPGADRTDVERCVLFSRLPPRPGPAEQHAGYEPLWPPSTMLHDAEPSAAAAAIPAASPMSIRIAPHTIALPIRGETADRVGGGASSVLLPSTAAMEAKAVVTHRFWRSHIRFFVNGEDQGIAFVHLTREPPPKNDGAALGLGPSPIAGGPLQAGLGRYFPAASCYGGGTVKFNPGPHFAFPPSPGRFPPAVSSAVPAPSPSAASLSLSGVPSTVAGSKSGLSSTAVTINIDATASSGAGEAAGSVSAAGAVSPSVGPGGSEDAGTDGLPAVSVEAGDKGFCLSAVDTHPTSVRTNAARLSSTSPVLRASSSFGGESVSQLRERSNQERESIAGAAPDGGFPAGGVPGPEYPPYPPFRPFSELEPNDDLSGMPLFSSALGTFGGGGGGAQFALQGWLHRLVTDPFAALDQPGYGSGGGSKGAAGLLAKHAAVAGSIITTSGILSTAQHSKATAGAVAASMPAAGAGGKKRKDGEAIEFAKPLKPGVLKSKGRSVGATDGLSEETGPTIGRKRGRGKAEADHSAGGRGTAASAEGACEVPQAGKRGKSATASSSAAGHSHADSPAGSASGRRGQRAPLDASGVDEYGYPIPSGDAKRRRLEKAALAVAATTAVLAVGTTAAPGPAEGEAGQPS